METNAVKPAVWRLGLVVCTAAVVALGARGAFLLSEHMMNSVALVGAWVMLALTFGYLITRFRPSVGGPILVGVGAGAVVVAVFAGMAMMV